MQDAPLIRYFVVRSEGGDFEFVDKPEWYRLRREVPIFGAQVGSTKVIYDRIRKRRGYSPFRRRSDVTSMPVQPTRNTPTKRDLKYYDLAIFDALDELEEQIDTHLNLYDCDREWLIAHELDSCDYEALPESAANIAVLSIAVGLIKAAQTLADAWVLESDPDEQCKRVKLFENLLVRVNTLIAEKMPPPIMDVNMPKPANEDTTQIDRELIAQDLERTAKLAGRFGFTDAVSRFIRWLG